MQQNCAVHSRGVYWLALHDSHCPHKGQEQQGTQNGQTADCAPLLAAVVFMHSLFYQFDTLFCIVHAFQLNNPVPVSLLSGDRGSSAIIRYYCYIPCTSTLLQATACHTFHTLYVLSFLICY